MNFYQKLASNNLSVQNFERPFINFASFSLFYRVLQERMDDQVLQAPSESEGNLVVWVFQAPKVAV